MKPGIDIYDVNSKWWYVPFIFQISFLLLEVLRLTTGNMNYGIIASIVIIFYAINMIVYHLTVMKDRKERTKGLLEGIIFLLLGSIILYERVVIHKN